VSEPAPHGPVEIAVKLDWSDIAAMEARHVNQALAQLGPPTPDGVPDGIYVGLGAVLPPMFPGAEQADDESRRRTLESLQADPVKVAAHGRFHMSRGLVEALIQILTATAAQYDAAVEQAQAARPREQR